jgi:hypothetical protein
MFIAPGVFAQSMHKTDDSLGLSISSQPRT